MIKNGIIGYGYWGPNLVRNFSGNKNYQIAKVADSRQERLDLLKRNSPTIAITPNPNEMSSGQVKYLDIDENVPLPEVFAKRKADYRTIKTKIAKIAK